MFFNCVLTLTISKVSGNIFLSSLGPIFKFLSILGHNFFRSRTIKIGYRVLSRNSKMRFCVRSGRYF